MGSVERRIERLAQDLATEVWPPPQVYIDAQNRRTRYMRLGLSKRLGAELTEGARAFAESYRDSELHTQDSRVIERYRPPRSPKQVAEARKRIKETLDEMAEKRRACGY
jgi:cytochrome P450